MFRQVPYCSAIFFVLFTLAVTSVSGTETEERVVPELRAYRVNPEPPTIDGNLDEPIWSSPKIEFTRSFTQMEPDEGEVTTESTQVAVAYDDHAVYVAFWCYDSEPDKIDRQLVRRDRYAESDNVTVCIDAFHDHQTCRRFEVSAAGVQSDTRYFDDGHGDRSWDAVWESGVRLQTWGWTAEMRIPYHCLRFSEKEKHVWGIDFTRSINRKNEYVKWSFVPSSESGYVSKFGHLTDIHGIKPAGHLELLPYMVSSAETESGNIGNLDGRDYMGDMGFDLKYGMTSNLVLDATINPDFGQVELDQPVLNLSSYETWFPERRPFFLEGSDLFNTEFDLFYSRRIGRSPWADVDDPEHAYYTEYPDATTILGAAKLTGKLADRTSVALLNATTQKEKADYAAEINQVYNTTLVDGELDSTLVSVDTVFREGMVEPEANYTVLRVKQDVLRNSSVGGMMTLAGQDHVHPAVTGGFDWRLCTNSNAWQTRGQVVFSRVDDANTGYGVDLTFEKSGGKHVRGAIGGTIKDPYLNINRLGFAHRVNSRSFWGWMQYRTNDDWWIIRNSWSNFNIYASWNFDGVNFNKGGNFNGGVEFTNNWSLFTHFAVQGERYSDDETRGHGLWEWPVVPTFSWHLDLNTDERKMISFDIGPSVGSDRSGTWWDIYLGADYRPRSNMEFSLGGLYHRSFMGTRWIDNPSDDTTLFGDLDKDQLMIHASASVVFHRNFSCQLSAQGLISGLDYQNCRPYLGHDRYGPTTTDYGEYDYNWSRLNSTLLIRWEYLPGSTLYLVWTRSKSEYDDSVNDLDVNRDLDRFFSAGAENVFLVKASYWMNI